MKAKVKAKSKRPKPQPRHDELVEVNVFEDAHREKLMAKIDDLLAATAVLTTSVDTEIARVEAVIAALQAGAATDAQIQAATDSVTAATAKLDAERP